MSGLRPTEMTIRRLLLKELEKRGVKVNPEISFMTPIGRIMPDAVLQNGGDYVVETKLGPQAKLFDAMIRLYDYYKYTEARGAFAILFPEQLRRPWPADMIERIAMDPKLSYVITGIFRDHPSSFPKVNTSKCIKHDYNAKSLWALWPTQG